MPGLLPGCSDSNCGLDFFLSSSVDDFCCINCWKTSSSSCHSFFWWLLDYCMSFIGFAWTLSRNFIQFRSLLHIFWKGVCVNLHFEATGYQAFLQIPRASTYLFNKFTMPKINFKMISLSARVILAFFRTVAVWEKEHQRHLCLGNIDKSAVAQHGWETGTWSALKTQL